MTRCYRWYFNKLWGHIEDILVLSQKKWFKGLWWITKHVVCWSLLVFLHQEVFVTKILQSETDSLLLLASEDGFYVYCLYMNKQFLCSLVYIFTCLIWIHFNQRGSYTDERQLFTWRYAQVTSRINEVVDWPMMATAVERNNQTCWLITFLHYLFYKIYIKTPQTMNKKM